MPEDLANGQALQMLQGIWNEVKAVNTRIDRVRDDLRDEIGARLDQTNARIDDINGRLDQTIARLDQANTRLDQTNVRLDAGFALMDRRFDQLLLGEHGKEHREFRERIGRIEAHVGLPPKPGPR